MNVQTLFLQQARVLQVWQTNVVAPQLLGSVWNMFVVLAATLCGLSPMHRHRYESSEIVRIVHYSHATCSVSCVEGRIRRFWCGRDSRIARGRIEITAQPCTCVVRFHPFCVVLFSFLSSIKKKVSPAPRPAASALLIFILTLLHIAPSGVLGTFIWRKNIN